MTPLELRRHIRFATEPSALQHSSDNLIRNHVTNVMKTLLTKYFDYIQYIFYSICNTDMKLVNIWEAAKASKRKNFQEEKKQGVAVS